MRSRPQPRAPYLSGHCRASTASSRSQWAVPDLNRELQISERKLQIIPDEMSVRSQKLHNARYIYIIYYIIYIDLSIFNLMSINKRISDRSPDIISACLSVQKEWQLCTVFRRCVRKNISWRGPPEENHVVSFEHRLALSSDHWVRHLELHNQPCPTGRSHSN